MGKSCGTHVKCENSTKTLVENLKGREHFGDLGLFARIDCNIKMREIWREDVDWISLAQDRIQLRALVNTAMNLRVAEKTEIS
jgi:hypothetical protein